MKKISIVKTTFALFCAAFLFLANSTNPPNGRTGAPYTGNMSGNEPLCGGCHAGNALGFDGTLDIVGVPATIQPNTTYPLSVTITKTAGDVYRAGFQMLILDDDSEDAGTASNFDSETTVTASGGRNYIEHGSGAIQFGANSSVSYTFDWTSPTSITGDNITFYMVTVLGNGSGTSQDYSFTNYPTFPFAAGTNPLAITNLNTTDPLCNNDATGSATVMTTGGSGTNTYAWSSGGNMQTESNLSSGNYMVSVTSAGESITESFTINNPPAIVASITNQTSIDCNNSTATATVSATGGTGNLSYLWDNNDQTATATGLSAGNHSVTVFDSNQCQEVQTVNIASDTFSPTAEAGQSATLNCTNNTVQLNGAGSDTGGNISYQWQTGNGSITSGATTLTPTVSAAGTYTLTVTNNSNGCASSDFVFVTNNGTLPTANAGQSMVLNCNVNQVALNGNGSSSGANFTYQWTGGNIVSGATTLTPTVSSAGTYVLTVTDNQNGCESVASVSVDEDTQAPNTVIANLNLLDCNQNDVVLNGSGSSQGTDITYQWIATSGNITGSTTASNTTANAAGEYCLTTTNNQNGCSSQSCVTIIAASAPTTSVTSQGMVTCNGATDAFISVSSTGGSGTYDYLWSTQATSSTIQGLGAGIYSVTTTDENQCTNVISVTITEPTALTLSLSSTAVSALNANDGTATANGGGGTGILTYIWSNSETTAQIINLASGTYSVTVTDENNCTTTGDVSIGDFDCALTINEITANNVACNGEATGQATVDATSESTLSYAWSSGGNAATEINLAVGLYTVTVSDATNCEAIQSVTITESSAIVLQTSSTVASSSAATDGTAIVSAQGGTGNYTFLWNDAQNQTTDIATDLQVGDYCVTVTDTNGCEQIGCVSVTVSGCASLAANTTSTATSCNGFDDGTATINVIGGSGTYSYAWSSGGVGVTETDLTAGVYFVTVTDTDDCSLVGEVTVEQPSALTVQLVEQNNIECAGQTSGSATVQANGGTSGYTYAWSNGGEGATQMDLSAGEYQITATDSNNCQTTFALVIIAAEDTTIPTVLTQNITLEIGTDALVIGADTLDNGSFDNCGLGALTISQSTFDCDDLGENEVSLFVTDINGNTNSATAVVTVIDMTNPVIECPTDYTVACDGTVTYIINATDNCEISTISFPAGMASGDTFPIGTTTVTIDAMDSSDNSATCSFDVVVENVLGIAATGTNVSCNGASDGDITFMATGGTPPYIFTIENGIPGQLSAGVYDILLTDASGCTSSIQVEITEPMPIVIEIDQVVNEENTAGNGAIVVDISGGVEGYIYSWTGPDTFTSNQEDLVNLSAGDYVLVVTDENGCEATTEVITVDRLTSIEAPNWAKNLRLFPNPTSTILTLELPAFMTSDLTVELLNVTGQTLQFVDTERNGNRLRMNVSALPSGLYWVKVQLEGTIVVRKVVVE